MNVTIQLPTAPWTWVFYGILGALGWQLGIVCAEAGRATYRWLRSKGPARVTCNHYYDRQYRQHKLWVWWRGKRAIAAITSGHFTWRACRQWQRERRDYLAGLGWSDEEIKHNMEARWL